MEESWQAEPPPSNSSNAAWIITENSQSSQPHIPVKIIAIIVVVLIMLAGTGSVVFMISQSTRTLNKAADRQAKEISNLLDDGTKPDTTFSVVGEVQAQDYENPLDPNTSYSNPFTDNQNPFQ